MRNLFYISVLFMVASACNTKTGPTDKLEEAAASKEGGVTTVNFYSADSLKITADYYPNESADKIIVLMHQAGFSRGEYTEIAPRLVKQGYACLAVDLRSGNIANEVINETALRAKKAGLPQNFMDALPDVMSAIKYASYNSQKKIVLWGSSYSAGLAIMAANKSDKVTRVVSFSPGEYFNRQGQLRESAAKLKKPIFLTGAKGEFDISIKPLAQVIDKTYLMIYEPTANTDHGAKALWSGKQGAKELWDALLAFL